MRVRKLIYVVLTVVVCLVSCKRMELHVATSSVYLKIDTDRSTVVDVDRRIDVDAASGLYEKIYGPDFAMYHVCFYDKESHGLIHEAYLSSVGGFLDVPAGVYDVIVYSYESPVTHIEDFETRAGTYARTSSEIVDRQTIIEEPEQVFVYCQEDMEIPVRSEKDDVYVIEITADKLCDSYTIDFEKVEGADKIKKAEIYVTGQFQGRYLWEMRPLENPCTIKFEPVVDVENGRIYSVFNTFGRYDLADVDVDITLVVTDQNDLQHQWRLDATDIVDSPDNDRNEIIIDNLITIPDTDGGSGFVPDVNDWEDDVTNVPIS